MFDDRPAMKSLTQRLIRWVGSWVGKPDDAQTAAPGPSAASMSATPAVGPEPAVERLEDGRLVLFPRNGIWQARIHLGAGRYVWRSLRTTERAEALREGMRALDQIDLKRSAGLPLRSRSLDQVIAEYLLARAQDHDATRAAPGPSGRRRTSAHMRRQLRRVAKFWSLYAGTRPVDAIDDAVLRDYIPWRRRFYHDRPDRPPTARLDPADTTLRWEMMVGRLLLKFAQERGYRGGRPMPAYSFAPSVRRARPAFTIPEFRRLHRALRAWAAETARADHAYMRRLLRDYALVLAHSGLRIGEANDLRWRDVEAFRDGRGRRNVRLHVRGKTGKRVVIPRVAAARHLARLRAWSDHAGEDDLVFAMPGGRRIGTLATPFNKVLARAGLTTNSAGEKFTLYSLRHFYAVQTIAKDIDIFMIARNMGTSVAMIEQHYGRGATPQSRADRLGG